MFALLMLLAGYGVMVVGALPWLIPGVLPIYLIWSVWAAWRQAKRERDERDRQWERIYRFNQEHPIPPQ